MQPDYPLISILVLCYNNQKYIYENLNSIFIQTYPNLEVLIADDASDSFNAAQLINWIFKNKTSNIKKIAIFENKLNVGTVASLENLQKKSEGEYLFNIAADDVLFDKNVIMSLYQKAIEAEPDAQIIFCETEMWDEKLENKIGDFLGKDAIEKIKNSTALELFAECSWHPFFPACYLYKRSFLRKISNLSKKYVLIEDWATQIIMCREGIKPVYCDIRSSIKHRDGGISHGNSLNAQVTFLRFYHDLIQVYSNEVEPFLDKLTLEERKRAKNYAIDRFRAYYKIHLPRVANLSCDKKEVVKVSEKMNNTVTHQYLSYSKLRRVALKLSNKESIVIDFIVLALITCIFIFSYFNDYMITTIFSAFILGIMCCFIFSIIVLYFFWRKNQ